MKNANKIVEVRIVSSPHSSTGVECKNMSLIDIVGEYPKFFVPPVLLCRDGTIAILTILFAFFVSD